MEDFNDYLASEIVTQNTLLEKFNKIIEYLKTYPILYKHVVQSSGPQIIIYSFNSKPYESWKEIYEDTKVVTDIHNLRFNFSTDSSIIGEYYTVSQTGVDTFLLVRVTKKMDGTILSSFNSFTSDTVY